MALIIASLAWLNPARIVRAQVLTVRERTYVQVARLSGVSGPKIIVTELLPNVLPYLVAALVTAVSGAILASIGLEVLGLGPLDAPTLGMTLYWVNYSAALINGWWWWWLPPIVVIAVRFLGLFFLSIGLDEFANPRLRRSGIASGAIDGSRLDNANLRGVRCGRAPPAGREGRATSLSWPRAPYARERRGPHGVE